QLNIVCNGHVAGRVAASPDFATFSNLEMQHFPKIFCIFLQKVLAKNNYADADFLKDLVKGLESRWSIKSELADNEYYTNTHRELYTNSVESELNAIAQYKDMKFEDSKLQEKAISYINLLNDQLDALNYVTVDIDKYESMWSKAYNKRTQMIADFIDSYELEFSDEFKDIVTDMKTNAVLASEDEEILDKVQEMINGMTFTKESADYNWCTYVSVIENISPADFDNFSITVNLLDSDGTIVDTHYDSVDAFKSGQKAKFEFSTDKKFKSTEIVCDYVTDKSMHTGIQSNPVNESVKEESKDQEIENAEPLTDEDFVVILNNEGETKDILEVLNTEYGEGGYYYFYYDVSVDKAGDTICLTKRSIDIGSSKDEVLLAYGEAECKKFDTKTNELYLEFLDNDPAKSGIMQVQCVSYVTYEYEDKGTLEIYFDSNDNVSWIVMYN
ncbi:MAG: FxLYD domain-containing protein, partial [Lachnospiraceae bacterium]|nr:FxLYD domain-containing protein [Lachnospiraceae bacterium]